MDVVLADPAFDSQTIQYDDAPEPAFVWTLHSSVAVASAAH
jgi:hypothetical protein